MSSAVEGYISLCSSTTQSALHCDLIRQLKYPKCCIINCSEFDLKMVWNFRLCFSTIAISNSFSSDSCAKQDLPVRVQLHRAETPHTGSINMKVALIKRSKKERAPISLLCYNLWRSKGLSAGITLWPWDSCQSVQGPQPNMSKGPYPELWCISVQPLGDPAPWWGSRENAPCSSSTNQSIPTMPADGAVRKDGYLTAGWTHTPGVDIALFTQVKRSECTKHSINALLPLLKLVKKK